MQTEITRHANRRIKERVKAPKRARPVLVNRALEDGIRHDEVSGSLYRYLDLLRHKNPCTNNIRILEQSIYLFAGNTLITVLRLPRKYYAAAEKAKKKREAPHA